MQAMAVGPGAARGAEEGPLRRERAAKRAKLEAEAVAKAEAAKEAAAAAGVMAAAAAGGGAAGVGGAGVGVLQATAVGPGAVGVAEDGPLRRERAAKRAKLEAEAEATKAAMGAGAAGAGATGGDASAAVISIDLTDTLTSRHARRPGVGLHQEKTAANDIKDKLLKEKMHFEAEQAARKEFDAQATLPVRRKKIARKSFPGETLKPKKSNPKPSTLNLKP